MSSGALSSLCVVGSLQVSSPVEQIVDASESADLGVACERHGTARWRNLNARVQVAANLDAFLNFGIVRVVNVIGFRYTYNHGTLIADWVTDPEDWFRQ